MFFNEVLALLAANFHFNVAEDMKQFVSLGDVRKPRI